MLNPSLDGTDGNQGRQRKIYSTTDKTDRRIIKLLELNSKFTQSDLAKELGLSQATIAMRLSKLQNNSLLVQSHAVNYMALGLQMCRVDIQTTEEDKVMAWAIRCPLFVNGSKGLAEKPMSLYFVTEDVDMFHYIVDEHLKKISGVTRVDLTIIRDWIKPYALQLDLDYSNVERPPCGVDPYCPRCPSNPKYDGRVWNHQRLADLIANK